MTFGASGVPGEVLSGPVEWIADPHVFVGVQVIPALAADIVRPGIPGKGQGLFPAARKLDQVLLQWLYTERMRDGEFLLLADGVFCLNEERIVLLEERCPGIVVLKLDAGKVPKNGCVIRDLHRQLVM